ncbi:hypothetical protein J6G99_06625 [bacterium]|nr:hypothetical protein [bacterium]
MKTILIDLDGVLNYYTGDYDENYIPPILDGASDFIKKTAQNNIVKIFTTRNKLLTAKWLIENKIDEYIDDVTNVKNPAWLIIDDRCLTFKGDFEKLYFEIQNFKPWYK